ncbi:MAG: GNAT family N-acetyltransferase [Proteobacteria bacterium]|nr:GNAT family N-acetyltransferase [Pseudomonadota bacterium]
MASPVSVQDAIDELSREPLRHIVLLKHLLAYPDHVRLHRAAGPEGTALLVALETSVSAYDRQAYPKAALAALVTSDHPWLTEQLMAHVPPGVGVVFKLSQEIDPAPIADRFPIVRRTSFVSFTSSARIARDGDARVSTTVSDAAFRLFEQQGHERGWLEPLLRAGKAFACVLERDGEPVSGCFAFENYGPVWEVGGVVTASPQRRKGFGGKVVRTALAELNDRSLAPRYQVDAHNEASIRLARSVGLAPFLTVVHYASDC